jgi:arginine exporter protein ArgO
MRVFALIAGILFILLGIAGFAKMLAMATMYAVVLIVAGALFALYGATNRRPMVPMGRTSGRDMRDLGGA